jgi:hypothetical protein
MYAVFYYKDDLAQDYAKREYIEKFCELFNCKLPSFSSNEHLLIDDNAIVYNKEQNTIKIYAVLNNIAKYNQAFPNLDLKFKDINGKIVKHQVLKPKDYLENQNNNGLLKHSKQYINIVLADPGVEAINYEINLAQK